MIRSMLILSKYIRQYKIIGFGIQFFYSTAVLQAGFDRIPQPTVQFGRGNSGIAIPGAAGMMRNPSLIGSLRTGSISFSYVPSQYQLSQLSTIGLYTAYPSPLGTFGAGISSYGFSLYRESVASLLYAAQGSEQVLYGGAVHLNHLSIANYGNDLSVSIDAGITFFPFDDVAIGTSLHNINRPRIGSSGEYHSFQFITGGAYSIQDFGLLSIDIVKEESYPIEIHPGFTAYIHENIELRGSYSDSYSKIFGGITVMYLNYAVEYGVSHHETLGITHSFGISYSL